MAKRIQLTRVVTADGVDLSNYVTEVNIKIKPGDLSTITLDVFGKVETDPETGHITVTVGSS